MPRSTRSRWVLAGAFVLAGCGEGGPVADHACIDPGASELVLTEAAVQHVGVEFAPAGVSYAIDDVIHLYDGGSRKGWTVRPDQTTEIGGTGIALGADTLGIELPVAVRDDWIGAAALADHLGSSVATSTHLHAVYPVGDATFLEASTAPDELRGVGVERVFWRADGDGVTQVEVPWDAPSGRVWFVPSPSGVLVAESDAPFRRARISDANEVEWLTEAGFEIPPRIERTRYIALPLVPLDRGYLQTIADLLSDRRLFLRYDCNGEVAKMTELDVSLAFVGAFRTEPVVMAVRDIGEKELVFYEWVWQ